MVAVVRPRSRTLPALALVAALASCGRSDESGSETEAPATADPAPAGERRSGGRGGDVEPARSIGEEPYDSSELGALFGEISFEGTPPERFLLGAAEAPECKHHPEVDQRSNVVVVEGGKLANVYVYLKSGIDPARVPDVPAEPATLEQRGCMYVPRVLGMRAGQGLRVTNGDPTTHNVHTKSKLNSEVNKTMGASQAPLEFRFERSERPVPFKCDIHPWMGAAVYVEEHPWFAVSDAQGRFRIEGVPPGEYVVEALHEDLKSARGRVSVRAGTASGIAFTFRAR